ncbi:iron ABC transporter permease [Acidobacteria bacterium ACD]|nr:iron ABC transporter permease [Acidobacteria bacterium ACD]
MGPRGPRPPRDGRERRGVPARLPRRPALAARPGSPRRARRDPAGQLARAPRPEARRRAGAPRRAPRGAPAVTGGAPSRARTAALLSLLAAIVAVAAASLLVGSVPIPPGDVARALTGEGPASVVAIVRELRLPRLLLGLLAGGALALSGASLQALLQNPLADPYLLGVSGGAACGTLVATLLGVDGPLLLPAAALAGALVAVAVVGAGASVGGRLDRGRLLLSGVVVNALASAVLLFLLSLGDPARTRGFVFWMLGSLAGATPASVVSLSVYTLAGALVLLSLSRALDAFTLGEETAFTLGVGLERTKRAVYVAASLLAAAAVAHAGIIGFVGLLVPHGVRLFARGHRHVLVLSFLAGAANSSCSVSPTAK